MILAALNDYYDRLLDDPKSGIAPPGYSTERIGFAILLGADGTVTAVHDLRDKSGKKSIDTSMAVPASFKRPGIGSKAFFLWDKSSYVLGVSSKPARAPQDHEAFKALHREALQGQSDPGLKALLAFLDSWDPTQFDTHPQFAPHGEDILDANIVFRFGTERNYLHDRPASRDIWGDLQASASGATRGMCLVTGKEAALARLHPAIKGVNGAQSSGASLVSFNLESFTSYKKAQGDNAPVSEKVAEAYTSALNHLLRRDPSNRQRLQIGDTTVVFWAQAATNQAAEEAEDLFAAAFSSGLADDKATTRLGNVLGQVRQMRPLRELPGHLDDGTRIYVLGLAPNASRLSIRFWETQTLETFACRLADHYDDLELRPLPKGWPPSPSYLALQTAPFFEGRGKAEDIPPQLAGELTRAILSGSRYPRSVLANLIMRFRMDGHVSAIRVALCRAVLAREARLDASPKEIPPVSLDIDNKESGYVLGRLFSALENIQQAALGSKVNATIRDRYYGAASATPAGIFPVLIRNTQNHLGKIRKDKPGLSITLEKDMRLIVDALPPHFPRTLDIRKQGQFAIGYYHQTQARFTSNDSQDVTDNASEGDSE